MGPALRDPCAPCLPGVKGLGIPGISLVLVRVGGGEWGSQNSGSLEPFGQTSQ